MVNLLSTEAKETMIKKVLSSSQSMRQIALANNIGNSTLHKWVQDFKRNNKIETIPKKSLDMTAEERFKHRCWHGTLSHDEINL